MDGGGGGDAGQEGGEQESMPPETESEGEGGGATETEGFATDGSATEGGQDPDIPTDGPEADTENIGETEGLGCGGLPIAFLTEARVWRASDVQGFDGLDPNGYLLVLSSVEGTCDGFFDTFDCTDPHEYRLYLEIPPNPMVGDEAYLHFGGIQYDVDAWIQASRTAECVAAERPQEEGILHIYDFDPETLEMNGEICNYYTENLGFGLAGDFGPSAACPGS